MRLGELEERCRSKRCSLGPVSVVVAEDRGGCPLCEGPMRVEKTAPRSGQTLAHGAFRAQETIHVCAARCRWPSGALVTRRAVSLCSALIPGSNFGYDVMVFVGLGRLLHHKQREELQAELQDSHGITISTGEVSELTGRFAAYFARLHLAHADEIKAALEVDGG